MCFFDQDEDEKHSWIDTTFPGKITPILIHLKIKYHSLPTKLHRQNKWSSTSDSHYTSQFKFVRSNNTPRLNKLSRVGSLPKINFQENSRTFCGARLDPLLLILILNLLCLPLQYCWLVL